MRKTLINAFPKQNKAKTFQRAARVIYSAFYSAPNDDDRRPERPRRDWVKNGFNYCSSVRNSKRNNFDKFQVSQHSSQFPSRRLLIYLNSHVRWYVVWYFVLFLRWNVRHIMKFIADPSHDECQCDLRWWRFQSPRRSSYSFCYQEFMINEHLYHISRQLFNSLLILLVIITQMILIFINYKSLMISNVFSSTFSVRSRRRNFCHNNELLRFIQSTPMHYSCM